MLKIGHRGAMAYEPENTLASFDKAIKLGVDGIELDVHLCRSGEVVVIHDNRVNRTTNGRGQVRELTFSQLQELDAGNGEHIPSLREVLEFVDRRVFIDIELKGQGTAGPVAEIIGKFIRSRGWKPEQFWITSFDHHELKACHDLIPDVPFGPLLAAKPLNYARLAEDMGADGIMPLFEFLDENFVRDAHQRGLKVITWTVNRSDDIKNVLAMGVDGIISNFPDRLFQIK